MSTFATSCCSPGSSPMERPQSRRILVVDDNAAIHDDFRKTLCGGIQSPDALASVKAALFDDAPASAAPIAPRFEVDSALQGQEGLAKVCAALDAGRPYCVAFVDMRMPPGWDGLETVERFWEADPNLQLVICSAYTDHSWSDIARKVGYTDRLLILKKPFDPIEVAQLATSLSEKWQLKRRAELKMSELEALVEQRTAALTHAAMHDKLTGLPNRALLRERLGQCLQRRMDDPSLTPFAVLFLDFDRFKTINDSLGHDAGDQLLIQIAGRLTACSATGGTADSGGVTVARLGGDEFVVLSERIERPSDAGPLAEQLLNCLAHPYDLCGRPVTVTASIGITTSDVGYVRPEEMLRDADSAMYHAKAAGKACHAVFDARMHAEASARLEMENDLRRAIAEEQFEMFYQPVVSLETGRLEGFEGLLRWQHPTRGLVMPGAFVPLCEETGLIVPIGRWTIDTACRQLRDWQKAYPHHAGLTMSVNLSGRQLFEPDLIPTISRAIRDQGIAPQTLALEITESVMIRDIPAAVAVLEQIRALGVRLHMDDFGTGYSSLSCLHQFPLDAIKIDRSFIRNVTARREYAAVVRTIVELARNLGMSLIAEGLETHEQVVMLQTMDCDRGQGYLFGAAMPASEAGVLLAPAASAPVLKMRAA